MRQHPDGLLLPARQRPSHAFAPAASHAVVRIANDRGGQIGGYVERYEQLRATGQTVMIDGLCASSCTIVLGAIPHEKICVTRSANLAFHAAWDFGAHGQAISARQAAGGDVSPLLSRCPGCCTTVNACLLRGIEWGRLSGAGRVFQVSATKRVKPGTGWRMLYSQMAYIVNADAPNDAASRSIGMNLRG